MDPDDSKEEAEVEADEEIISIINDTYDLDEGRWLISLIEEEMIILEKFENGQRIITRLYERGEDYDEVRIEGEIDSVNVLLEEKLEKPLTARIRSWRITKEQFIKPPGISDSYDLTEKTWQERLLLSFGLSFEWAETFGERGGSRKLLFDSIIADNKAGVMQALARRDGGVDNIYSPADIIICRFPKTFPRRVLTPLMIAVIAGNYEIVRLLITEGADLDKTINHFRLYRVNRFPAGSENYFFVLGRIYFEKGSYENARKCFEETLQVNSDVLEKLSELYEDKKWVAENFSAIGLVYYNKAKEYMKKKSEVDSQTLGADKKIAKADSCIDANLNYALKYFGAASNLDPANLGEVEKSAERFGIWGLIFYYKRNYEVAQMCFDRVLTIDDQNLLALSHLGSVHFELGKYVKSAEHYRSLFKLEIFNNKRKLVLMNLAACCEKGLSTISEDRLYRFWLESLDECRQKFFEIDANNQVTLDHLIEGYRSVAEKCGDEACAHIKYYLHELRCKKEGIPIDERTRFAFFEEIKREKCLVGRLFSVLQGEADKVYNKF
jgi:tetratricopeptide (TPR) repeat protein